MNELVVVDKGADWRRLKALVALIWIAWGVVSAVFGVLLIWKSVAGAWRRRTS
jgi:hypothetical protein